VRVVFLDHPLAYNLEFDVVSMLGLDGQRYWGRWSEFWKLRWPEPVPQTDMLSIGVIRLSAGGQCRRMPTAVETLSRY